MHQSYPDMPIASEAAMLMVIDLEITNYDNECMTLFCKMFKQISEIMMVTNIGNANSHTKLALYALATYHSTIM